MSEIPGNISLFIRSGLFGSVLLISGGASANICSGTTTDIDAAGFLDGIYISTYEAERNTPISGMLNTELFVTLPPVNHISYYRDGIHTRTEYPGSTSYVIVNYDMQGYNENSDIATGTSGGTFELNSVGKYPVQLNYFTIDKYKLSSIKLRELKLSSFSPKYNEWLCKFQPGQHNIRMDLHFSSSLAKTQFAGMDLVGNVNEIIWRFPFIIYQKQILNISTVSQVDFGKVFLGERAMRQIEIKMTSNVVNKRVMFTYTASGLTKDDILTIDDRPLPYEEEKYTSLTQWDEEKFSRDIRLQRTGNVTGKLNAQLHINAQFN